MLHTVECSVKTVAKGSNKQKHLGIIRQGK